MDGDFAMVAIAASAGAFLHAGGLRVQAFGNGDDDAMRKVGQEVRQVPGDELGGRDD